MLTKTIKYACFEQICLQNHQLPANQVHCSRVLSRSAGKWGFCLSSVCELKEGTILTKKLEKTMGGSKQKM